MPFCVCDRVSGIKTSCQNVIVMRGRFVVYVLVAFALFVFVNWLMLDSSAAESKKQESWRIPRLVCEPAVPVISIKTITVTAMITPSAMITKSPSPSASKQKQARSSPVPLPPSLSNPRCVEYPDFSGLCLYDQVCFDGKQKAFIIDNTVGEDVETQPPFVDMSREDRYRQTKHFPEPKMYVVPYAENRACPEARRVTESYLTHFNITHVEGAAWFSRPRYENVNPYYFPKDNNMLWEAQWWNKTNPTIFQLPSLDHVFTIRHNIPAGWQQDMLDFYMSNYPEGSYYTYEDSDEKFQLTHEEDLLCFSQFVSIRKTFSQSNECKGSDCIRQAKILVRNENSSRVQKRNCGLLESRRFASIGARRATKTCYFR